MSKTDVSHKTHAIYCAYQSASPQYTLLKNSVLMCSYGFTHLLLETLNLGISKVQRPKCRRVSYSHNMRELYTNIGFLCEVMCSRFFGMFIRISKSATHHFLAAQKLCQTVGIDWACAEYDELEAAERQAWLNLFAEALIDCQNNV